MKKFMRFFLNHWNGYHLASLVKPVLWNISGTDKILVLAPHADDESIGCGGLLAKFGPQCDVVLLTDGAFGKDDNTRLLREQEFSSVMNFFKVHSFSFMRAQDTRLIEAYDLFKKIDFSSYDYVVMPHPLDPHKDHVVPQAFFKRLKKENPAIKAKAVYYEVWGAMAQPTHLLNITAVTDIKKKAIDMYVSQSNIAYADRILALNHYRGMRADIAYAEAYEIEK